MDSSFAFFILFSFVLIALLIFTLLSIDQLKKIRRQFKWKQSAVYFLGNAFILVSFSLGYFIYLHFSVKLAVASRGYGHEARLRAEALQRAGTGTLFSN